MVPSDRLTLRPHRRIGGRDSNDLSASRNCCCRWDRRRARSKHRRRTYKTTHSKGRSRALRLSRSPGTYPTAPHSASSSDAARLSRSPGARTRRVFAPPRFVYPPSPPLSHPRPVTHYVIPFLAPAHHIHPTKPTIPHRKSRTLMTPHNPL